MAAQQRDAIRPLAIFRRGSIRSSAVLELVEMVMGQLLPSATAIALGVIGVFSGLFASLLTLRGMREAPKPRTIRRTVPRQPTGGRRVAATEHR